MADWQTKRVLVTGGAGFLGSHLCDRLIADGAEVLCVDNFFTGRRSNVAHLLEHPRFELMRHDVTFPLYVEVDEIYNLAKKYSLDIYEDAAQALGSKFKEKFAGTFGIASAISLYPAKILGTLGDGGAVLTNDKKVYENLLLLRDHGRDPKTGEVVSWGFNSRLDNLQAAFLNYFIKDYENVIDRRRFLASLYDEALSSIEEVQIPPGPQNGDHFDVFQNYEVRVQKRDELKNYLAKKGIGTLVQWGGKAIHHFKSLKFNQKLPVTDKIFSELLMLPLNMFVSDDDVKYIVEEVKKFYKKK